ncbi:MAG: SoxR reducing system RseC family protein [Spirochaetota bacterium]
METECGIVKKVTGNYVVVEADAVSFCSSCGNHECTMRQSRGRQLLIENTMGAQAGDRVFFVIPSKGLVLSSFVIYGIPIVFLIAGILLGSLIPLPVLHDKEVSGMVIGIAFLLISFMVMRFASKQIVKRNQITPEMIKVEKLL